MDVKRREYSILLLVLGIIALVGMNSYLFFTRCDLTENGVYTLSPVSRELYRDIPEQVTLTYYISDRLKSIAPEIGQIEDMLYEFQAHSRGTIVVETVDPVRQQRSEEAETYGVESHQIQTGGAAEVSASIVYSGLVIHYLDRYETIGTVYNPTALEYDLVSRIRKVVSNDPVTIGLLAGNSARAVDSFYNYFQQFLAQNAEVQIIQKGEDIAASVDALVVLDWVNLEEFDLYPIDQYLMQGGRVLFAGQGVDFDYLALANSTAPTLEGELPIFNLLTRYGVSVGRDLLLDQSNTNFRYQVQDYLGRTQVQDATYPDTSIPIQYPFWVVVRPENADASNPINAHFIGLQLLWPSSLAVTETQGLRATTLLRTTDQAWTLTDEASFNVAPEQAIMLSAGSQGTASQRTVAVALEGVFPSYFADRPVPAREGETREWAETVAQSAETRAIVISDVDFLSDAISVADPAFQQSGSSVNFTYIQNCVDWLAGQDDILTIRNREARDMTLSRISDENQEKLVQTLAMIINVAVLPLVVIVFGIVRLIRRRRLSQSRMETHDAAPASGGTDASDEKR